MKVVVKKLDREISNTIITNNVSSTVFYIRTAYNSSKDIILTNYINGNQLLSFKEAFVGDNTLADSELMTSPYLAVILTVRHLYYTLILIGIYLASMVVLCRDLLMRLG